MRSVPQPIPNRLLLFDAGPFPVADAVGEDRAEALALGVGEFHGVVSGVDGFKTLLVIGPPAIMRGGGNVG